MNDTADVTGFLGSDNFSGFGYGVGVSVGMLILIITITLASYFCARTNPNPNPNPSPSEARSGSEERVEHGHFVVLDVGLDEATIRSYPKLLYSEAKLQRSSDTCCSVCLADYKLTDRLRMLPDCRHLFHRRCVDPWLRMNPSCPVCRTSPLPTPLSTPLAEVVPLASRRD